MRQAEVLQLPVRRQQNRPGSRTVPGFVGDRHRNAAPETTQPDRVTGGGYHAFLRTEQDKLIASFSPPDSLMAIFPPDRYSDYQREVITTQHRRDRAQRALQEASGLSTERRAILHGAHQRLVARYEKLLPQTEPDPEALPEPIRLADRRTGGFTRFIQLRRSETKRVGTKDTRHPLSAEEKLRQQMERIALQDVIRAHDEVAKDRLHCDLEILPNVKNDPDLFFNGPLDVILDGLPRLLTGRNIMFINEAELLLEDEIDRLSPHEKLYTSYINLWDQWPHIIALGNNVGIQTATGAMAYYEELDRAYPREDSPK